MLAKELEQSKAESKQQDEAINLTTSKNTELTYYYIVKIFLEKETVSY